MRVLVVIFAVLLSLQSVWASCLTSSEEYAVEVVIPSQFAGRIPSEAVALGEWYAFPSTYDSQLLVLLKQTRTPEGLAVRLQLPTTIEENTQPHLKLLSTSAPGVVKSNLADTVGRWSVRCTDSECTFTQDAFTITAETRGTPREVTLDISEPLAPCSDACSGACIATPTTSRCLPQRYESDIETLLRLANISDSFEELLASYRVLGSEELVIIDIVPSVSPLVNWEEAVRQELVTMRSEGALTLPREDIEAIARLARRGQAGQNYRIVFDTVQDAWMYYDQTVNPSLTAERDCTPYTSLAGEPIPLGAQNEPISLFFLVPLALGIVGILLIILLALVARLMTYRSRRGMRVKPVSNLPEWDGEKTTQPG